jgi:hypothetical protein
MLDAFSFISGFIAGIYFGVVILSSFFYNNDDDDDDN